MALFRGRGMSDPQPVEISYREGMTEAGIVIDDATVEGGPIAANYLELGDIIEINGVSRRVVGIKRSLVAGRPGIEGVDATARVRHEPPDAGVLRGV